MDLWRIDQVPVTFNRKVVDLNPGYAPMDFSYEKCARYEHNTACSQTVKTTSGLHAGRKDGGVRGFKLCNHIEEARAKTAT